MKDWTVAIQARTSLASAVLTHIKESKMLGTIPYWLEHIDKLRFLELHKSKKFRTFIAYMNMLGRHSSLENIYLHYVLTKRQ